ncbi:MAG: carboxypeptidase regulatory-like domain-containing protein [Planctomycetes bacterium]|nr:carboxypeptidase regulatory-like domain-containing protein [Planctomycetota bacterium]
MSPKTTHALLILAAILLVFVSLGWLLQRTPEEGDLITPEIGELREEALRIPAREVRTNIVELTERPESSPAATSPALLTFIVQDPEQNAISGARAFGLKDSQAVHRCTSGEDGRLQLVPATDESGYAIIAPGFVSREVPARDCAPSRDIVISLERERRLQGRIVTRDGAALPRSGVRVLLSRIDQPLDGGHFEFQCQTHPATLISETDAYGAFTMGALEFADYEVRAAGAGFASLPSQRLSRDSFATELQVRVAPIFGSIVNLVQPGGERVRASKVFNASPCSWATEGLPKSPLIDPGVLALLGLKNVSDLDLAYRTVPLIYFGVDENQAPLGPVDFFACAPGYKGKSIAFHLPRILDEVPQLNVELERTCKGFGSIQLEVAGAARLSSLYRKGAAVGTIYMERMDVPPDGFAHGVRYQLKSGMPTSENLEGIPIGKYALLFSGVSNFHQFRGDDFEVHADSTTNITLDLSRGAALSFEFSNRELLDMLALLSVKIERLDLPTPRVAFAALNGPIYGLWGLSAGEYRVEIVVRTPNSIRSPQVELLRIEAGETRTLRIL